MNRDVRLIVMLYSQLTAVLFFILVLWMQESWSLFVKLILTGVILGVSGFSFFFMILRQKGKDRKRRLSRKDRGAPYE